MSSKYDSGVSVVIAFIIILAIIAIAVGMWGIFGIPSQVREANEVQTIKTVDALTDYKVILNNLHKPGYENVDVSTLFPVGSSYSVGSITLKSNPIGVITVIRSNDDGNPLTNDEIVIWSQEVTRLSMSVGNTGTEVGYEGGGIYRNDDGNYVWEVYPSFSIFKNGGDYYISLGEISKIEGDFSVSGSGDIAINTHYISYNDNDGSYEHDTEGSKIHSSYTKNPEGELPKVIELKSYYTITYTSDDPKDLALWYSLFYETKYRASADTKDIFVADNPTINGYSVSMKVTLIPTEDISSPSASAYLYGYTYGAEVVPDIVVREPEVIWSVITGALKSPVNNVYYWKDYTGDSIDKGYIFFDRSYGDHYICTSDVSSFVKSDYAYSYYLGNKDKMAIIDRCPANIYTESDISGNSWVGTVPKAGSLYYTGGNLYVCVYMGSGSPNTEVTDDGANDWRLLGVVNPDKYSVMVMN